MSLSARLPALALISLAFISLQATNLIAATTAIQLDSIAASVYNKALTCYDVEKSLNELQQQLQQSGAQVSSAQLYSRALDSSIMWRLQQREARILEIKASEEEINAAIRSVEKSNQLQDGELKLALQAQGIDYNNYRDNLEKRILSNKLINIAVRGRLKISEESLREYYRKYLANPKPIREIHLAQIFINLASNPSPEDVEKAANKASKILQQLENNSFSKLVTLYSDAPDASSGGDMGWFSRGGIAPNFTEVFELNLGTFSKVIRSPAGFHIIQVSQERWKQPEVGESHDEIHARHILLKIPKSADENTRAKIINRAQNISKNMQNADDEAFATRAKDLSQGPSASRGGDLGWFKQGQMVKAFEDVAFDLKAGQTSGIVESPFGLHIIRVLAKRHVDPNSFEARRNQIQEVLINAEMQSQVPRWLKGLKAKAPIERFTCPNLQH
ncbi:MAG: peptidylprolyl isomerase [Mariprofundaceae bacterium]